MPEPEPHYVLHTRQQRFYGGVIVAFGAILLIVSVVTSGLQGLESVVGLFVGAALLAWVFFLQPRLELNPAGVHIHNPFRSIDIPFAQVADVTPRWGLIINEKSGANRRVSAFPAKGMKASDPWPERRAARFLPTQVAAREEFNPQIEIPLWDSGIHKFSASTRSATRLMEEMLPHFNSKMGRRLVPADAPHGVTVNWLSVGAAVVGIAAIVWSVVA